MDVRYEVFADRLAKGWGDLIADGITPLDEPLIEFAQIRSGETKMRIWPHCVASAAALLLVQAFYIFVPTVAYAQSGDVVLWNKLGSDAEIATGEVGPGGNKTAGSFTPGPFADFGQAYVNAAPGIFALTFPAQSIPKSKGTIAFWAKLNNFPNGMPVAYPLFIQFPIVLPMAHWRLGFSYNDGCGGIGLHGTVGVGTSYYCGSLVDTATQSGTLDTILGDRGAWHHYAMVWNEDGIVQLGGRKVYIYLDGRLVVTPYLMDKSPWGSIPSGQRFSLAYFQGVASESLAVDNLIIWNDVKTDFSDRFNESPFPTCDGVLPRLSALIASKTGTQDARSWAVTVSNNGYCPGQGVQIDGLKLTQTYGVACAPVITHPAAFPLKLGDIAAKGKASGDVTINFSACSSTARFTAKITYSANDGAVIGSKTLNNQFR